MIIEEYAFSFGYSNTSEEVVMIMNRTGSKKGSTTFRSNASDVTPHQMRSSACKMIRRLVSLMRNLDPMPEERTVLLKLMYYDDTTVKNVLQKYDDNSATSGDYDMNVDDDYLSNTKPPGRRSGYVLVSSSKKVEFLLDSGATHHICNDKGIMRNLKDVKEDYQVPLYSCTGAELKAEMMGSVMTKNFKLGQVGFIPEMAFNVVSVSQLASQGLLTNISDGQFSITSVDDARVVGEGFLKKQHNKDNGSHYYEYIFRTMNWVVQQDDEKFIDSCHESESGDDDEDWVIDTGCWDHIVPTLSMLSYAKRERHPIQSASGTMWATHKGSTTVGELFLKDVRFCKDLTRRLLSGAMLDLSGHRMTFNAQKCTIVHKDGLELKGVGILQKNTGLYLLQENEEEERAIQEEKNLVAETEEDELIDSEERKNESMMKEEEDDLTDLTAYAEGLKTAEAEQSGLPPDAKDGKNKRAPTEDTNKPAKRAKKGKAAKRTKRRQLK